MNLLKNSETKIKKYKNENLEAKLECYRKFLNPSKNFIKYFLSKKYKGQKICSNLEILTTTKNIFLHAKFHSNGYFYIRCILFKSKKFYFEGKIKSGLSEKEAREIIQNVKKLIIKFYRIGKEDL